MKAESGAVQVDDLISSNVYNLPSEAREALCSDEVSAKSKLSVTNVASIDIVPAAFSLHSTKLSIEVQPSLSIPPRPIYHPAVIKACQIMHGKLPSQLSSEEI